MVELVCNIHGLIVVVHVYNPSIREAEARGLPPV